MDTSDLKFQYLNKQYENLIPLEKNTEKECNTFLAVNKENKKIVIKKYVAPTIIPIYQKLKLVSNPHLAKIYHCACTIQTGIVIEEFISGVTLRDYLEEKKTLNPKEVSNLLHDLCDVLKEIHHAAKNDSLLNNRIVQAARENTVGIIIDANRCLPSEKPSSSSTALAR